jgi:crotonobetainyl-CoA:carnitine CoA-transferase CaiB-like acyl-CoA transferase
MAAPPLDGVRVIEAASYLSGPYTGQMLADLGAEVIKVEAPPRGDDFRRFNRPPALYSPIFANANRGKRSVLADLKDPAQREAVLDLVATSDVWITNWRPGVAERLGMSDDALADRNPRLVRLYLSGYGAEGPRADAPVFDTVIQATSGLTHALAGGDQPSLLPGFPLDKTTAALAAQAVTAALFARERTGQGERIDMSMLAAAAYVNFVELFANRTFVDAQPDEARNLQAIRLRPLRAKDGWLTLAPVSGAGIKKLCETIDHPEWAGQLQALGDQRQLAAALFTRLDTVFPTRTVDDLLKLLSDCDIAAARCLSMDEHLADPQVAIQDIYRIENWDEVGQVRTVRYPAMFASAGRLAAPGPAPRAGQDNSRYLPPPTAGA